MRLNSTQVERTLSQMNAQVLPDDHPAVAQLTNMFGDHTFFLDESGLKVLEPAGVLESYRRILVTEWVRRQRLELAI
jgi:hypothetical protein